MYAYASEWENEGLSEKKHSKVRVQMANKVSLRFTLILQQEMTQAATDAGHSADFAGPFPDWSLCGVLALYSAFPTAP